MKNFTRILAVVLAAGALQAFAQNYPVRPVRAIIAFPPGSATDIIGRVIAAKVTEIWGQTGGAPTTAAARAARSPRRSRPRRRPTATR